MTEVNSAHLNLIHTPSLIPQLSVIYEAKGDIDQACDVVQDVHVETYGALSKKEKVILLLTFHLPWRLYTHSLAP